MRYRLYIIFLGCMGGLVTCATADARFLPHWPYDKLQDEADVILIVQAVETKESVETPPEHHWKYEFAGLNTKFKVLSVLKGKDVGDSITMIHFKFGDLKKGVDKNVFTNLIVKDGPLFCQFDTKKHDAYLLYLKRRKDGKYEPLSGQIDPILSVRKLDEQR